MDTKAKTKGRGYVLQDFIVNNKHNLFVVEESGMTVAGLPKFMHILYGGENSLLHLPQPVLRHIE